MIWGGEGSRGGWRGGVDIAMCYGYVIWRRQGSGGVEGNVEGSREGWRQKEIDKWQW